MVGNDIKYYNIDDLILKVNKYYDTNKYDLYKWDAFIDKLCQNRDYQKQAIYNALYYFLDSNCDSLKSLAFKNFENNEVLKEKYNEDFEKFLKNLQLPDKKYASLDLATGTGKSYVLYAIAQIMLGLGIVSRVLILCPSTTIEYELSNKFNELVSDPDLKKLIPQSAHIKNPRIIDANSTVKVGDICIENIHAVYENTGSSIDDSFNGTGIDTLILNDEAHHIFNRHDGRNAEIKNYKKWKDFLLNEKYNFKYMLGVTGTAYIENEYFSDVIYRYSLNKAIEDRIVKNIEYVLKDDEISEKEKFLKIYQNHKSNKLMYDKIKPLTIIVTRDIDNAKLVAKKLAENIASIESISVEEAMKKILVVTSTKEHKDNIIELREVDNISNAREWIISVSMLTEGWDVKNVFQIVPWEDRAFNSKLLISQVLGRGLRLPEEYKSPQPKVIIFNHASWSKNIKSLVDQVLELTDKLSSQILKNNDREKFNFKIYNLNYDKYLVEKEHKKRKVFDYSRMMNDGIKLEAQVLQYKRTVEYSNILNNEDREEEYFIDADSYSVDEVIDKIYDEFSLREWEGITLKLNDKLYTKNELPPRSSIEEIIRKSMLNVGITDNKLSEKNRNYILRAFNTLLRQNGKTVEYISEEKDYFELNTKNMNSESINVANLRRDTSIFYSNMYSKEVYDENLKLLQKIINDETLPRQALKEINIYDFKTPVNIVITTGNPERSFVKLLCDKENSKYIDSWIKSRDKGFYSLNYSWMKNSHRKNSNFNPDFFIVKDIESVRNIIVVEIKDDGDDSIENKAKYKYGNEHFDRLNYLLEKNNIKQHYIFHFLSPNSYDAFFQYLKDDKLDNFKCELENLLEE